MGVSKFMMCELEVRNYVHVKVSKYAHMYALEIRDVMSFRRLIPSGCSLAIYVRVGRFFL